MPDAGPTRLSPGTPFPPSPTASTASRRCGGPSPRPTASTTRCGSPRGPPCGFPPPRRRLPSPEPDPARPAPETNRSAMPPPQQHTHKFKIKVDGSPLTDAVDRTLVSAFVDDNLNLPDMFQLVFRDPDRVVLEQGHFRVGSKVAITVVSEATPGGEQLVSGKV